MGEGWGRLGTGQDRKRSQLDPALTPQNIELSLFIKDEANEI